MLTGNDSCREMAIDVIVHASIMQQAILDDVIADNFGHINHCVAANVGHGALPQSGHALLLADHAIRLHGRCVSRPGRRTELLALSLEPHLDHIGGLGQHNGHAASCQAGHDAGEYMHSLRILVEYVLVDGLHAVVQTEAHRCEAHLTLQAG